MAEPVDRDLVRGLRDGRSWAFRLMNSLYTPRLVARARAALGQRLRQKVDPEDVVQSVYYSLLRGGDLVPDDRDELWRLLLHRTRRKAARKVRLFRRKRRDVALEETLDGSPIGEGAGPGRPSRGTTASLRWTRRRGSGRPRRDSWPP